MKLLGHPVEKPWGRTDLPPRFAGARGGRDAPVGEIWFEPADRRPLPLLAKYIFTSEKLSVQVHPDDASARARGLPNGKTECWYIVDAEAGAALALGFREPLGEEALREAALDGSIEKLLDWKPVRAGDFFHVPAGTVHAIGGGISLIEIQQPSDTTYRLYDYGRPRELHIEEALAVARREPYPAALAKHVGAGTAVLVEGEHFRVAHVAAADVEAVAEVDRFVLPLEGSADAAGETAAPGECLLVPAGTGLSASANARLLVASTPLSQGERAG